jgi:photosystem II stability/assembly factor-like uncharacterized protein
MKKPNLHFPFFFIPSLFQLFFFSNSSYSQSPKIEIITSGGNTSLRGLCVVNDNIIWASGSNGTVGRSTNGGKNWKWFSVKGFEKKEFRDIEAFDANVAIIMAVDTPAYILKTIDGGVNWKIVYENKTPGMFLDAMDFANSRMGIVIGDPINGKIFVATTHNSGNTWEETNEILPFADKGEAFFAASGSNVRLFANNDFFMVSGGTRSRLITADSAFDLPVLQGKESTGANSLDFYDNGIPNKPGKRMVVVGGDFANDSSTEKNCFYSINGGKTWKEPQSPPHGYRSSVEFLSQKDILSCGLNGVDYSSDGGKNWKWISKDSFHVCRIARIGTAIFLAGNNGRIGKVVW